MNEGRRGKEEGRRKQEEGIRKKEEGRTRKKKKGRKTERKKDKNQRKKIGMSRGGVRHRALPELVAVFGHVRMDPRSRESDCKLK